MDNFALFICGLVVTLMSGMGVIIYAMTPPTEKKLREPEPDIDLGAFHTEPDSLEIPSVS